MTSHEGRFPDIIFETYKALEDTTVEVLGWRGRTRAWEVLQADRRRYSGELSPRSQPG